uniref:Glycosyltransferase n=1 Tax=viral metagenome TaxID=1070528 RepID=A0A6C0EIC6_9ZZZZ
MTIPLIIHQIWWQGENNISKIHNNYRNTWIKKHKKWKLILWDQVKFEILLRSIKNNFYTTLYSKLPYTIQKIDFAKYIILYYYGGIYTDIDTICERPLDSLLEKYKFNLIVSKITVYELINYKLINNGIIIASKKNKFFNYVILEISNNLENKFYYPKDYYIICSTGPICFSKAILNYVIDNNNTDIKILEDNYLESCKISDLDHYSKKGSYITHIHNSSWTSPLFKIHFEMVRIIEKKGVMGIVLIVVLIILFICVIKIY